MRPRDLDIDALRSLVAVADTGGFTAAGELLGRTQSAISIKIKKLEDSLGTRLFDRTSRSLTPTSDGELLLGYARRLLDLNDEAVLRFAEPEAEGVLRLGVNEYFVPQHLPQLLRRFSRVFPRVRIEVKVALNETLLPLLEQNELDIVITKRNRGMTAGRVIWTEPLVWVAARDYPLPLDPHEPVPLCSLPSHCPFREQGLAALAETDRAWRIVYSSGSIMGVQAAVSAGLGVAVMTRSAMADSNLRVLTPEDGLPALGNVDIAVFGENAARSPLVRPFEQFILASLRQLPGNLIRPAA